MARMRTCEAIVLRTWEIGEADRFCVFLTREFGRINARARSVRKEKSRMGALLLSGRHLHLELSEHRTGGHTVTGARLMSETSAFTDPLAFLVREQGIELLLRVTDDDHPHPELYELVHAFSVSCSTPGDATLTLFTIALLLELGFLPHTEDDYRFSRMSAESKEWVLLACHPGSWDEARQHPLSDEVRDFADTILKEIITIPLKSRSVRV